MFPFAKNTTPFWYPQSVNFQEKSSYPFGNYPKPQISDLVVLAVPFSIRDILSSVSKGEYRYDMNTQEKDNEIYGEGNSYSAEYWQYDARLARRWNVDPVTGKFPDISPYIVFNNNPIYFIDPFGLESKVPERQQVTVQSGDNLWKIAKNKLGSEATNAQIQSYVNELKKINNLDSESSRKLKVGQTIYIESEADFQKRKEVYDRVQFLSYPKVLPPSGPSPKLIQGKYLDDEGNFVRNVNTWKQLFDASITGTQVSNIEGELLGYLKRDIQDFKKPTGNDLYTALVIKLKKSGDDYVTGVMTVRFGSIEKLSAATQRSVWTMRNATLKYWVSYADDGSIKFEFRVLDYFNVVEQEDKDDFYNNIARYLEKAYHNFGGGNKNMQVRAVWEHTIKN